MSQNQRLSPGAIAGISITVVATLSAIFTTIFGIIHPIIKKRGKVEGMKEGLEQGKKDGRQQEFMNYLKWGGKYCPDQSDVFFSDCMHAYS